MNDLVSIVVPIYNKAEYLNQCIESVLNQTYTHFQLILVDDGSTDESLCICEKYAEKDNRVKVIHQENQGLSVARNTGLDASDGKYLLFLDADDFWRYEDGLKTLLSHPSTRKDDFVLLEFNRSRFVPSKNSFYDFPLFSDKLLNANETDEVVVSLIDMGVFPMSACTKLINRFFLVQNNIKFIPGLLSEDYPWYLEILLKAKTGVYFTNYYLYGNRSEISTSLSSVFSPRKLEHNLWAISWGADAIKKSSKSVIAKESLLSSLAYKYCLILVGYTKNKKKIHPSYGAKVKEYEWILQYARHPKVKKVNTLRKWLGDKLALIILNKYTEHRDIIKYLVAKYRNWAEAC